MTLNSSGPISLGGSTAGQSINLELGKSATAQVSLNDTDVRTLAGVPSGTIIMPTNFYGKSAVFTYSGTMTQGIDTSGSFTTFGYDSTTTPPTGSISPTSSIVASVIKLNNGVDWFLIVRMFTPLAFATPQNYWGTMTLAGTFSINSSSATSFLNGNTWQFQGVNPAPLTGSGNISLVFS